MNDSTANRVCLQGETYTFKTPRTIGEIRDMISGALMKRGLYKLSVSVSLAAGSDTAIADVTLPYLSEINEAPR